MSRGLGNVPVRRFLKVDALFPRPAGFYGVSTMPTVVMEPDIFTNERRPASLIISERSDKVFQSAALRTVSAYPHSAATHAVNGMIEAFRNQLRKRPGAESGKDELQNLIRSTDPERTWDMASCVTTGTGGRTTAHTFGALRLDSTQVVLLEVHVHSDNSLDSEAVLRELVQRIEKATTSPRSIFRALNLHWLMVLSAVIVETGSIRRFTENDEGVWIAIMGLVMFSLACLAVIVLAVVNARRASRTYSLFHAIWEGRSEIARYRIALVFSLVTIGISSGLRFELSGPILLFILALLLGGICLFLGLDYRLIRAIMMRSKEPPKQPESAGRWTEVHVAELPAHFSVPAGNVTAFRLGSEESWATINDGGQLPEPTWSRWQEETREWKTERGLVTARAYQTWDSAVETVAEAIVGTSTIRVETPLPPDAALSYLPDLVNHRVSAKPTDKRRSLLAGTFSVSYLPSLILATASVYLFFLLIFAPHAPGAAVITVLIASLAFYYATPFFHLIMTVLVIIRPTFFALQGDSLRTRTRRVLFSGLMGALPGALFAQVFFDVFGGFDRPYLPLLAAAVLWLFSLIYPIVPRTKKTKRATRKGT